MRSSACAVALIAIRAFGSAYPDHGRSAQAAKRAPLSQLPGPRAKWGQRQALPRPSRLSWQIPRSSLSLYFDPAGCKRNDKTFGRGPALGSNTDQIDVLNCSGTDQTSDRWRMTRGSSRRRRGEVIDGALW